jgi:Zn-dependent protease/tetratricopeptide (TPR) repeat protein
MRQFIIMMLAVPVLFASFCYADKRSPLDDAKSLEDKGKYEEAAYLYHKAIENDPYDPELYARYGMFLRTTGQFAGITYEMNYYARRLRESGSPDSLPALSEVLLQLGENSLATEALQAASRIMPERGDLALRLGDLYESTGRYSLAKKEYEAAAELGEQESAREALKRLLFLQVTRRIALIAGVAGLILFSVSLSFVLSRMREKKDLIEAMRKRERDYESTFSESAPFYLNPVSPETEPTLTPVLIEQEGDTLTYDFVALPEKVGEISTGVYLAFGLSIASLFPIYGMPFGFAALLILPFLARRFSPDIERTAAVKLILISLLLSALGLLSSLFCGFAFLREGSVSPAHNYYLTAQNTSPVVITAVLVAALLFSMAAHEAGHAVTAFWCGDLTAKRRGRLTLNPLKHIDLFGTIILPTLLLFVTSGRAAFGYAKPVPIDPRRFGRRRRDEVLTASSGSVVNLTLALASVSILSILGSVISLSSAQVRISGFTDFLLPTVIQSPGGPVLALVVQFLKSCILVNLFLGILNLIPIPPLDGSYLLENAFPARYRVYFQILRRMGFLILIVLLLAGALSAVFVPLSYLASELSSFLFRLTRIF